MESFISGWWIAGLILLSLILEGMENYLLGVSIFSISTLPIALIGLFTKPEYLIGSFLAWLAVAIVKEFYFNRQAVLPVKLYNLMLRSSFFIPIILFRSFFKEVLGLASYIILILILSLIQGSLYFFLLDKFVRTRVTSKGKYLLGTILSVIWVIDALLTLSPLAGDLKLLKSNAFLSALSLTYLTSGIAMNLIRSFFNNNFSPLLVKLKKYIDYLKKYEEALKLAKEEIEKIRDEAETHQKRFALLTKFHESLSKKWNLKDMFAQLALLLREIFGYQTLIFFKYDASKAFLEPVYYKTPYPQKIKNLKLRVGETAIGESIRKMQPILCRQRKYSLVTREREAEPLFPEDRVAMITPLSFNDNLIGALYLGENTLNAYSEKDLELLRLIGYEFSLMYSFYQEYTKSMDQAIRDGLTGLYTHRYFQERLKEEINRAKRYGGTLSLLMIDTDKFKKFNDTYGHPEGDKLLQRIANLLRSLLRNSDVICRYGGDEFAIILPNTNKEEAMAIAERIRSNFYRVNLPEHEVKVTTSIGVANYPIDASNKEELIEAADKNLYRAKREGRNRVVG